MTPTQAVALCRLVKACCPQQQIDAYTPDAWGPLLEDKRFEDCQLAVQNLAKRQPFISPSEIRDEVRRIRNDRLDRTELPTPPRHLADDPVAELAWRKEAIRAIGDGREIPVPPEPDQLTPRDMRALPEFPSPPEEDAA